MKACTSPPLRGDQIGIEPANDLGVILPTLPGMSSPTKCELENRKKNSVIITGHRIEINRTHSICCIRKIEKESQRAKLPET
jgi:hypothetical protein